MNPNHDAKGKFSTGSLSRGTTVRRISTAPIIGPGGVTGFKTVTMPPQVVTSVKKVPGGRIVNVKDAQHGGKSQLVAGHSSFRVEHGTLNRDHAAEVTAHLKASRAVSYLSGRGPKPQGFNTADYMAGRTGYKR